MSKQSETSDTLYLLDNMADMQQHILQLLQNGKRTIAIFSRMLNPLLFNHSNISEAISSVARSSQYTDVRILIQQPKIIVESNHLLLDLYRKIPSKIQMRRITIEPQELCEFMLVDDDKVWLQHKEGVYNGFANYQARPEAKRLNELFSDYWKNSQEDSNLRSLFI